jgi:hypothetical protein
MARDREDGVTLPAVAGLGATKESAPEGSGFDFRMAVRPARCQKQSRTAASALEGGLVIPPSLAVAISIDRTPLGIEDPRGDR